MISEKLKQARAYEELHMPKVPAYERPYFHVTGGIGWINDPNGFSLYDDEYHLFYQYHPYDTNWGPMHWGHVKSKDFITWERLPIALAPDEAYDKDGCFSGGAVMTPEGKHLLMYTGVAKNPEDGKEYQTQCIALGDGIEYEKQACNPVLTGKDVPEGGSATDFRDPKVWYDEELNKYFVLVANRAADGSGAVVLYESEDGRNWNYRTTIDVCKNEYGTMWECPDFFSLDGKQVLLISPMDMHPQGLEFHAGHGTMCILGNYDKSNAVFTREQIQAIDYGIDFYAPQTTLAKDGRRIMIGWMQSWDTSNHRHQESRWYGQMNVPRELSVSNGRLIQMPVRELENYRANKVSYHNVKIQKETSLEGVCGRILDMEIVLTPESGSDLCDFTVKLAANEKYHTQIYYDADKQTIQVDRSACGFDYDMIHSRTFYVQPSDGQIKLRIVMDKNSLELFVNDGEQAASFLLYTPMEAQGITFASKDAIQMSVTKYDLVFEEEHNGEKTL